MNERLKQVWAVWVQIWTLRSELAKLSSNKQQQGEDELQTPNSPSQVSSTNSVFIFLRFLMVVDFDSQEWLVSLFIIIIMINHRWNRCYSRILEVAAKD